MKETLRELEVLAEQRIQFLNDCRKKGTPVIAYTGTYIPEEVIRAAGAETYYLCRGGESARVNPVLGSDLRFMNPLARSTAEEALSLHARFSLPFFDLLVLQQTDCHTARAGEFLEFEGLPVHMVGIPTEEGTPSSFKYYVNLLEEMTGRVEEITGRRVCKEDARDNFAGTNRVNALFRELDELRRRDDPPFGFSDWIRLHHLSFMVDTDILIGKLEKLSIKLKSAPGLKKRPRIMIAGRAVAPGDYTVPEVIEESGALIVAEMLDECIRPYGKDVGCEGNLLREFAQNRYLDSPGANFMQSSWEARCACLLDRVERYRIDAVIWYQLSFDEIYDLEFGFLSKYLEKKGIPIMKLESSYDYSNAALGMLATRIESYVEAVK